ncbi:MAG: glutamyl-tRNA amidotransferase [Lachnospiraceae bacterium]|nr:glutamyl-tRNA amidotransferase [Lachnospiraceae bacterium]
MISISLCNSCVHYKGLVDGWKMVCDAFPEGIPARFEEEENKECNNGIYCELKNEPEKST